MFDLNLLSSKELNLLKFSGLDLKKPINLSNLRFEVMDLKEEILIAGTVEELSFANREYRTVVEIGLSIHQDETMRCLRIYPGGVLEGGYHCFLVSHSTRGDEEIPIIFKFIQDDSNFINCHLNDKLSCLGFKHLAELLGLSYHFDSKHRSILKVIERAMIIKAGSDFLLEISLYLNQNLNYKCLRLNLQENNNWSLISSFSSGYKSYSGEFKIISKPPD